MICDHRFHGQVRHTSPTQVGLPGGHWTGKRAARDILVLAGKGTAFSSMDAVIVRQGEGATLQVGQTAVANFRFD